MQHAYSYQRNNHHALYRNTCQLRGRKTDVNESNERCSCVQDMPLNRIKARRCALLSDYTMWGCLPHLLLMWTQV
jgi:hypothetical protein